MPHQVGGLAADITIRGLVNELLLCIPSGVGFRELSQCDLLGFLAGDHRLALDGRAGLLPDKVRGKSTMHQLADLISIIRFEMGYGDNLQPFAETVNYNFMRWTLKRNAGAVHFTDEQMEWLRLIKDHIAVSLSIEPDDLDLNPFDRRGGLGRFYEVFGDSYEVILTEMNIELVA